MIPLLPSIPWLAETSLRASVAILLVVGARLCFRRLVGSHRLALLSLVIALRLLLPWPVTAPWSFARPFRAWTAQAQAQAPRSIVRVFVTDPAVNPRPGPPVAPVPVQARRPLAASISSVLGGHGWTVLWLGGALTAAFRLVHGWRLTLRWAVATTPGEADERLWRVYSDFPARLRRGVALRLTDTVTVPTLAGVFQPQIWLPRTLPDTLTLDELRHVLLHELGHARRRDLPAQWVCSLACCVHWFNPLVWLLAHLARTDRELACDAWVLAREAATAPAGYACAYGHTLLKIVQGMRGRPARALPALVSMAAGKRPLELRVREIGAFRPVPSWRGAAAVALALAAMGVVLLRGATAAPEKSLPPPAAEPTVPPSPSPAPFIPPAPAPTPSPTRPAPTPLATGSPAAAPQVEIEAKFIEIMKSSALTLEKSVPPSSPVAKVFHQVFARFGRQTSPESPAIFRSALVLPSDFGLLVRQLNQAKGVDLLSAPRVTTKSEQKATIEIIREIIYPTAFQQYKGPFDKPVTTPTNFDKKNTGVTLEVTPTIEPDGNMIDLALTWTITNLDGFVDADGKPIPDGKVGSVSQFPVFDTHSVSTVATLSSDATVVFSRNEEHLFARKSLQFATGEAKRKASPAKDDDRLLLIFVTARLVNLPPGFPAGTGDNARESSTPGTSGPTGAARPSAQPTDSPAPLPYGVPAPGKPGFAISPYAPDAGFVDLVGFARGQTVRDPYTSKLFLVP